jgi:hypothetical protein
MFGASLQLDSGSERIVKNPLFRWTAKLINLIIFYIKFYMLN